MPKKKNSKHGLKTFFSCKQELYDKDKKTILNEMKDDKTIFIRNYIMNFLNIIII